jgi:hypothetical protein
MHTKAELARKSAQNDLGESLALVSARLKKLRRERHLVERAIIALTEIAWARQSRRRRPTHN